MTNHNKFKLHYGMCSKASEGLPIIYCLDIGLHSHGTGCLDCYNWVVENQKEKVEMIKWLPKK